MEYSGNTETLYILNRAAACKMGCSLFFKFI